MPDVDELGIEGPMGGPGDVDADATDQGADDRFEGVAVGPGPRADTFASEVGSREIEAPGDAGPPPLTSADYSVAFSPRNLAIGLAVVAGVVAFLASRRRGRSSGPDEVA